LLKNRIYLSPPNLDEKEIFFLNEAIESNWIAPLGHHVDEFEKEISKYLNVKDSAALSSATAAIHLALIIAGVKKNDKVLCPSLTFAATSNPILYIGAEPIFVDSNNLDWNIDIHLLELAMKKHKPKALISVDLYGQSCDYESIHNLCDKYNVFLIEDAAEALGSKYRNKQCGSFGKISALSFNGNKIITTSGGGMLVSDNIDYVKKARFLASQARENELHYEHKTIGFNYRLSNLLAAIGRGQLLKLDNFAARKREIYKFYYESLYHLEGISFISEEHNTASNRWLTTFTIDENINGVTRDLVIDKLEKHNIESRPVWKPMHLQPLYKGYDYITNGKADNSANIFKNGICLPSGSGLQREHQEKIINIVLDCFD